MFDMLHSTLMSKPRLPLELCEMVINSTEDNRTLCACSLACKMFLPATRRLLFDIIHLNKHTAGRFIRDICSSSAFPTSPCQYVAILYLWEIPGSDSAQWLNEALPFLATRLLNFTSLTLRWSDIRLDMLNENGRNALLFGFQQVKTLIIRATCLGTPVQASKLIGSFPSLSHLSYSGIPTGFETDESVVSLPQSLRSISTHSGTAFFFHRLLNTEPSPTVRSVTLFYNASDDIRGVGMFLRTLGPNLEDLHLTRGYHIPGLLRVNGQSLLSSYLISLTSRIHVYSHVPR